MGDHAVLLAQNRDSRTQLVTTWLENPFRLTDLADQAGQGAGVFPVWIRTSGVFPAGQGTLRFSAFEQFSKSDLRHLCNPDDTASAVWPRM